MRDPKRIRKFCNQLADVWETRCPDLRFGQLIQYIITDLPYPNDGFYIEDEEMMQHIQNSFKGEKQ